ncbi:hypothetical protein LK12_16590 [Novosphingobium malaysiense]|uniref:2Fe-2S ferredoxin-type domain-containing protein n=2 Tax=Novosphingobium malaysiense TaxID=1348853 RepID=A0A0B1ZIU1_9SPHN|nr:hypothetical protein LK12_16590 [Novosphingobium malaysiense]
MSTIHLTFVDAAGGHHVISGVSPGRTLMEAGRENGISGILVDCGGACACATCHVHVEPEWLAELGGPNDLESSMLDLEEALQDNSRLSCQVPLTEAMDGLIVWVPRR